jgi:hypothetical protein
MALAHEHQRATPGKVGVIDGSPVLTTYVDEPNESHYEVLRRVARRARRSGHALERPEPGLAYFAMYDGEELSGEGVPALLNTVFSDLASSDFVSATPDGNGPITQFSIPPPEDRRAHKYLPYFLYPLPMSTLNDIVNERMIIYVFLNTGRVVDMLRQKGYTPKIGIGKKDASLRSVVLACDGVDEHGSPARIEIHGFESQVTEIVMECKPLSLIGDVADRMKAEGFRAYLEQARETGP